MILKKYFWLISFFLTLAPNLASATVFYQNKGGTVTQIDEDKFRSCDPEKVIYRESGKDAIPGEFKRKLLNAALNGSTINDPKSASSALKAKDGACTFSEKDDLN